MYRIGIASLGLMVLAAAASAEVTFIGGTTPSQRPAGAPVITSFERDDAWFARALTGISEPIPPSLDFLQDQGAWYTPFIHPGMLPPYDIRNWHTQQ
ncbi:MAG: hypothetical protein KDK29_13830 [Sedimentitalea sp.]|nr:hypothetical protein [Sedimentitalea sp.]